MAATYKRTGREELQAACNLISNTRSDFADRFTLEQLVQLYRAYQRSEWDITPDEWTDQEIADALAGKGRGAESDDPRRGDVGADECAECGARFDATPDDETATCPACSGVPR